MGFRIGPVFGALLFVLFLLEGVKCPLMLFAAVMIHEGGHLLAAWLLGAKCRKFQIGLTGLSLDFDYRSLSYGKECLIQLSGSMAGLLSVWIAARWGESVVYYCVCALCLNLVNLLPIGGLDGGGILSSFLHMWVSDRIAVQICRLVSLATSLILWFCALWISLRADGNITVLLCGVFFLWKSLMAYGLPRSGDTG